MKKMIYILFALSSFVYSQDGCDLTIINTLQLQSNGDVWYKVDHDIASFEWIVEGSTVTSASGGDAALAGLSIQVSGSFVLGFSFQGLSLNAGCGVLTNLTLSETGTGLSTSDSAMPT